MNKHVLIFGGASGLGRIIAHHFLEHRWQVYNADIAPTTSIIDPPYTSFFCDATNEESVQNLLLKFLNNGTTIDAIINCIRYRKGCAQKQSPIFDQAFNIGFKTYFNVLSAVDIFPGGNLNGCSIVNISSILSSLVSMDEEPSYHISKAAIDQATKYYAVKFGEKGVRVNAILPGLISKVRSEPASSSPEASHYSKIANHIPLHRSGAPREVAELALFLASSAASYITGQSIVIDGGLSIRDQSNCIANCISEETANI